MRKLSFLFVLLCLTSLIFAETVYLDNNRDKTLSVKVNSSDANSTVLELNLNSFNTQNVNVNGNEYKIISLNKEGKLLEKGNPDLPFVGRSIIIPDNAKMSVNIISSQFKDYQMSVAPSKGSLFRNVNPEDVPYNFSSVYNENKFYPENIVNLGSPYIMRDFRGITVGFSPVQYNPVTKTLRVYSSIKAEIVNSGTDMINTINRTRNVVNKEFKSIYANHFLNYNSANTRYTPIEEDGTMLVITYPAFQEAVMPYVNWKRQKGIPTEIVTTEVAGTTANNIKTYIQNYYTAHPELAYIQLIGDAAQIPTLTHGGGGSDPSYVMLAGNDNYPELFIGRFSAENVAQVETQVTRSIWYERDITSENAAWLKKATGIASTEGGGGNGDMGESDIAHQNNIRTDLLGYGYTSVDQAYDPSVNPTMLSGYFNEGRGFVNYTGHGSNTTWVSSGYSNTNVNALTNDYKLPFIVSVACVNGNFTGTTCFAEAWLRAVNENTGAPNGAVVTYMSTVNQPWNEPMRGQDIITDLMIAHDKFSIGGLFYNGSSGMLDAYNNNTSAVLTMKTWTIFGDASLLVRNDLPQNMTVSSLDNLFIGIGTYEVNAGIENALCALYNPTSNELLGFATTDASGHAVINIANPVTEPCTLKLTVTAPNKVTVVKDVTVIPNQGSFITLNNFNFDQGQNPDFDSNVNLNVALKNVGVVTANNITATIRTASPYITLIDSVLTVAAINADQTVTPNDNFSFHISRYFEDQVAANFSIIAVDTENHSWTMNFIVRLNAPKVETAAFSIIDNNGNNNGRLDAGETATLRIPVKNNGHAASIPGNMLLNLTSDYVACEYNTLQIPAIAAADSMYADFIITAAPETPVGSMVNISYYANLDLNLLQGVCPINVGLEIEDFENGNLNSYPWNTSTTGAWTVVNTGAFSGTYCAKSGPIANSANTFLSVVDTVSVAGNIKFAVKVSSESTYDFLKFYVDTTEKGSWSGSVDWTEVEYAVTPGAHTFKWVYSKDSSQTGGSDCAWIDKITFPCGSSSTTPAPVYFCQTDTLNFSNTAVNTSSEKIITFVNFGNLPLNITLQSLPGFTFPELTGNSLVVPNNNNVPVRVLFSPTEEINYSGYLRIATNDPSVLNDSIYVNANGSSAGDNPNPIPVVTKLNGNYPNPFNPTTNISFSLKERQNVQIYVYNTKGQLVKRLISQNMNAGNHTVVWNGKDNNGRSVASGIYFYRMNTEKSSFTKKMMLIK
jgi:hypothetical protein